MWNLDWDEWEGSGIDGSGKFCQTPRYKRLHFRLKCNTKRLTVGLRLDLLGKLKRSHRPQWVPCKGTLSSTVRGPLRRGRGVEVSGRGIDE